MDNFLDILIIRADANIISKTTPCFCLYLSANSQLIESRMSACWFAIPVNFSYRKLSAWIDFYLTRWEKIYCTREVGIFPLISERAFRVLFRILGKAHQKIRSGYLLRVRKMRIVMGKWRVEKRADRLLLIDIIAIPVRQTADQTSINSI